MPYQVDRVGVNSLGPKTGWRQRVAARGIPANMMIFFTPKSPQSNNNM